MQATENGKEDRDVFVVLKEVMLTFLDLPPERIQPDVEIASLGLASLDWVEIQVEIEMRYGVRVDPELFGKRRLKTLAQLVEHVEGLLPHASAK